MKAKPKYSKMKRLITERDAKVIQRRGKLVIREDRPQFNGAFEIYRYKNATYVRFKRYGEPE